MELSGTIKKIFETQTFASGFQKREFVLLTQEQYPQPINIELLGDKIDLIDAHKIGDLVNVGINLRGREWTSPQGETRYFNTITAWKIIKPIASNTTNNNQPVANTQQSTSSVSNENPFAGDEDDDLPF